MRTMVVGDVHGGLKALKQVLTKTKVTSSDKIIFLGDYVDGWSESAQVIDFLINCREKYDCEFILGNHDYWCMQWLQKGQKNESWVMHGGKETMASYEYYTKQQIERHLAFFHQMKNYIIDEENRLFVHAGFSSMHGPHKEHHVDSFQWDRTLWETALAVHDKVTPDDKSFPKRLKLFKEIFIGHTPTTNWDVGIPWQRCNIWNVDTGAAFEGKLSVMDVDSKQYWQSDPVMELYPDEKGRN